MHGVDPGRQVLPVLRRTPGGGWGATSRADGMSATICINDGDTHNVPVEAVEAKYPMIRIGEYRLREDSGGAGRYRGGLGTRMSVVLDQPARLDAWMERTACAPWGLRGGLDAAPNRLSVERADGEVVGFPGGKVSGFVLSPGDRHVVETGGGGGLGDPFERPAAEVLADVRAGYVSPQAARAAYGVAVRAADDGGYELDDAATALLRTGRPASDGPAGEDSGGTGGAGSAGGSDDPGGRP